MRAAAWVAGILLWASAPALGAPRVPSWKLEYSHPDGVDCPPADVLRQQVSQRLGYAPWNDDGPGLVDARVTSVRRNLVVRVKVVSPRGEALGQRELRGQQGHCAELLDTAALTVSIAIDPLAVEETQRARETAPQPPVVEVPLPPVEEPVPAEVVPLQPEPAPVEEPPPAPPPDVTPADPAPSEPPRTQVARETAAPPRAYALRFPRLGGVTWTAPWLPRPRLRLGMLTTASTSTAPHPVVGSALHLDVNWGMLSAGVEARVEMPGTRFVGAATVQSQLTSVAMVPCLHGGPMMACAVGVAGIRHVESWGADFEETRSASVVFLAVGARVGVQHAVTRQLALVLGVDLNVVPLLTRLKDAGGTLLWSQPPITALAFAGVTLSPP